MHGSAFARRCAYGLEFNFTSTFTLLQGTIIDCLLFRDSTCQAIEFEDISDHVGQPDRFVWVELKSPDTRTISQLGDELGLHALALEDAISTHQRSKLEEYDKHVFIATRTVQMWESRMELGETHLFVGSNYVIAIRHDSGIDMAMAANKVILTTERIVSNDQIRRTPDQTRIPFFTVDAVVEAPMGCAPHECYGLYEPFFSHLDMYAELTAKDPVKGPQQYLEEYYHGPKSWPDYLAKLGMDAVLDACRRGRSVHND